MKQIFYTALFSLALCGLANSQATFTVTPIPVQTNATPFSTDTFGYVFITNPTDNTMEIQWQRTVLDITPDCFTQVCDPVLCWAVQVSSKTFTLDANFTDTVLVHMLNETGGMCCAIVRLTFTNLSNPAGNDTLSAIYLFNDCAASGTGQPLPKAEVRLLPNPVTEFFTLERAEAVAVLNVHAADGRRVATFDAMADGRYSLAGLAPGAYFVVLQDDAGRNFQVLEVLKN